MFAVASFTPAMFFSSNSRAIVSTDMSTIERPGNVVDDDRNPDRVVDRLVVLVQTFLGRLVVIGRDDQHGVGARLFGMTGQLDRLSGRIGAGTRNHRHAPSAWSMHHSTTCLCSSCDRVGLSPVVPTGTSPFVPSAICHSTMSRKRLFVERAVFERRDQRCKRAPKARLGGHDTTSPQ